MNPRHRKAIVHGSRYWKQYLSINGNCLLPTAAGLRRLSRSLELPAAHLRQQIRAYLAN